MTQRRTTITLSNYQALISSSVRSMGTSNGSNQNEIVNKVYTFTAKNLTNGASKGQVADGPCR